MYRLDGTPDNWEEWLEMPFLSETTANFFPPPLVNQLLSLYIQVEKVVSKEDAIAFYEAVETIERILMEAQQDGNQGFTG